MTESSDIEGEGTGELEVCPIYHGPGRNSLLARPQTEDMSSIDGMDMSNDERKVLLQADSPNRSR